MSTAHCIYMSHLQNTLPHQHLQGPLTLNLDSLSYYLNLLNLMCIAIRWCTRTAYNNSMDYCTDSILYSNIIHVFHCHVIILFYSFIIIATVCKCFCIKLLMCVHHVPSTSYSASPSFTKEPCMFVLHSYIDTYRAAEEELLLLYNYPTNILYSANV